MGAEIRHCLVENVGLWPKNIRKTLKNSKQGRDVVNLNFKKITLAAVWRMDWKAWRQTSGQAAEVIQMTVNWKDRVTETSRWISDLFRRRQNRQDGVKRRKY